MYSSSLIPSQAVKSVDASMKLDPGWQRKGGLCYSCSYCTGEEVGSQRLLLGWAWNSVAQHLPRICKVQDAITCITTEKIIPSDAYSRYDQCRVISWYPWSIDSCTPPRHPSSRVSLSKMVWYLCLTYTHPPVYFRQLYIVDST